jgi:site-specific recombinase XerD
MRHLPIYDSNYKRLCSDFEQFIKTKGYSRGNNSMYPSCVREFLFFIESRDLLDIKKVVTKDILAYQAYLMERPNQRRRSGGLSDSMIKGHLYSVKLFFDYLLDADEIESSPARLPKFLLKKTKERNILTVEEINILFSVCETRQDKAMIALAYGCGLRRSEIEKLETSDVHLQQGLVIIRDSKFHKNRIVPMSDGVLKDIKEYIFYERLKNHKGIKNLGHSLFINDNGIRKSGADMNIRLKRLIQKTQNLEIIRKEITLHCLRHSIATHLLDNGASMEFVQHFLGHSDIDTALIYSRRRKQRLEILRQFK